MNISITLEEAFMLDAMKNMRRIIKTKADNEIKSKALTQIFEECMRTLDSKELRNE